jgi:hypothetical protein
VRAYYDPTGFRHVGFFLRLDAGFGYMGSSLPGSSSSAIVTFDSAHGCAGELGLALGGAVAENVLLGAHFWGATLFSPSVSSGRSLVPHRR